MKISRHILAALVFALCAFSWGTGMGLGQPLRDPLSGAANGNPHDLSKDNTANAVRAVSETQVCIFCHTPHGGAPQSTLWNRGAPAKTDFPLYANDLAIKTDTTAKNESGYGTNYPNGASRLCLSCHDGVTAVGTVLNGGDIAMTELTITNPSAIVDLATSHPVSFKYDGSVMAAINAYHLSKADGKSYQLTTPSLTPLDGQSRMQCTTCHDPHNDTRSADPATPPFWRNASSTGDRYQEVCNNCHSGTALPGYSM